MSFLFSKTLNTLLGKYPLYCCVFILFVYPPFLRAQLEKDIDVFTKMGAESKPAGFNELPSLIKAHQYAASTSSQINIQRYRIYAEKAANDGLNSLMLPSVDLRLGLYRNRYQSDDPVLSYQGDAFNAVSDCQGALNVDDCILTVLDGVSYASQKSDFSSQELRLSVIQPIYDAKRLRALDIAEATAQSLSLQEQQLDQTLVMDLLSAFLTLLLASDELVFQEQNLLHTKQQLAEDYQSMLSGVLNEGVYFDRKLGKDQLEIKRLDAQTQFKQALLQWQRLSGIQQPHIAGLRLQADTLFKQLWFSEIDLQRFQGLARSNNLAAKQLNFMQEQAIQAWHQAKSGHYPTVNLTAYYANRDLVGGEGFIPGSEEAGIGIDVTVPIYHGGRTTKKISEMAYKKLAAEEEYVLFLDDLDRRVADQLDTILSLKQQMSWFDTMQSHAEKSRRLLLAQVVSGELPSSVMLAADNRQGDLSMQQRRLSYQIILELFQFKALTGETLVEDLAQIDQAIVSSLSSEASSKASAK